jgi:hypothetical protein
MTDSPDVLSNDELPPLRFLLQFCLQFGPAAGPFNNLGFDSNWNCPPNAKSSATVCIKKPASANPRWTAALFPLWVKMRSLDMQPGNRLCLHERTFFTLALNAQAQSSERFV